jgi:hypothetical protein
MGKKDDIMIEEYAKDLRSIFNRQAYTTLIMSLGTQLNDRKDRFDKSDIIERSVARYTDGRYLYVDDIGRDHIDTKHSLDVEMKYIHDGIFTKTKRSKKSVKVKLKNSLGSHKGTNINNPADLYMIGQQDAIAVLTWETMKNFLVAVPDGIEAHIPFDKLTFVFTPDDVDLTAKVDVSYKEMKSRMQDELIESVLNA